MFITNYSIKRRFLTALVSIKGFFFFFLMLLPVKALWSFWIGQVTIITIKSKDII